MNNPSPRTVLVRAFENRPEIKALLDLTEKAAFVCAPQQYTAIVEGKAPVPLCGFPRADVFPLTADLQAQVTAGRPINWSALQHI